MSLEKIYTQTVQGKQVGGLPFVGSASPPVFERDSNIRKLEHDVFAKLHEIVKTEPLQTGHATPDVQFVSFEDALKELANIENK